MTPGDLLKESSLHAFEGKIIQSLRKRSRKSNNSRLSTE